MLALSMLRLTPLLMKAMFEARQPVYKSAKTRHTIKTKCHAIGRKNQPSAVNAVEMIALCVTFLFTFAKFTPCLELSALYS